MFVEARVSLRVCSQSTLFRFENISVICSYNRIRIIVVVLYQYTHKLFILIKVVCFIRKLQELFKH